MLRRFEQQLLASLAAHGIALAAVGWFASRSALPSLTQPAEPQPVEIAVEGLEETARGGEKPGASAPVAEGSMPGKIALRGVVSGQGGVVPFPAGSAIELGRGAPVASAVGDGASSTGAQGGKGREVDLGLAPGAFWPTWPGSARRAPRPASTSGGLREALQDHDTAIGMGAGGPVVSAARSTAQSSTAMGGATMTVSCDGKGKVVSVRVADATRDLREWTQVAGAMAAALHSATLRVPTGSNGLVVAVRIEASKRLPSGSRAPTWIEPRLWPWEGKAGAEFDLSDVGQKPVRVISTAILSERAI